MIVFRQKEYAWPVIGAVASGAMTAVGIGQGVQQAKQNEEMMEQQKKDSKRIQKSLDNLAKSGASPEVKREAASLFSQKSFAVNAGFLKNAGGFVKDLWTHSGGGVKKAAKLGAGFAATGYVGNRIAASIKNHDEGNDDRNKKFLAKAAGTAALVGGGILAARKTGFGSKAIKEYMTTGKGGKALKGTGEFLAENVSPVGKKNGKYKFNAINSLFVATPTVSYLAQKQSKKKMVENTQQPNQQDEYGDDKQEQRGYANIGSYLGKFWRSVKGGARHLRNKPGEAITGGYNKISNFVGMMGNKGGTTATNKSFQELEKIGKESGNKWTQNYAKWMQKHKKTANVVAGTATIGVGTTAMGLGGKAIDKPMKAIDSDAYKMDEEENQQI